MIKHLRLKAYGKINLALDVLGRREDGYHEVRMIMQTVGLHDRIDLYATQEPGIRIETNLFYLPDNEQNLAHKAARLLMEEFGIRQGLSIHLRKFIPVSAGMAGGSTDAASHILKAETIEAEGGRHITVLNPGSVSIPKGGNPNTYAVLENGVFSIRTLEGEVVKELKL